MELRISEFQIVELDPFTIIISEKGVVKIKSIPLVKALYELNQCTLQPTFTTKKYILEILEKYSLPPEETFLFLEQILTFQKKELTPYFAQIIIAHDWDDEFEKTLTEELPSPIRTHKINKKLMDEISSPETFILIMPKDPHHHELKKIYYSIAFKYPKSALCVAMRIADFFYVSQPYLPELGTPCHFCNIDKISHTERVRPSANSWFSLLNFCHDHDLAAPKQTYTRLQRSLAIGLILERLKLWTYPGYGHRTQDRITSAAYINLLNGQTTEEQVAHWAMCECLRPTL